MGNDKLMFVDDCSINFKKLIKSHVPRSASCHR